MAFRRNFESNLIFVLIFEQIAGYMVSANKLLELYRLLAVMVIA